MAIIKKTYKVYQEGNPDDNCNHKYQLTGTYITHQLHKIVDDPVNNPLSEFGIMGHPDPNLKWKYYNPMEPFFFRRDAYYCDRCGSSYEKITVAVSNDDNKPLTNVPIFARLNGNNIVWS